MKKLLFIIIGCFFLATSFAQTESNVDSKTCFCCGDLYQLIPPVISGPSVAQCGTTVKFTWPNNCPGVIVGRNYSPFPPGATGGGDNVSSWFNIPAGYTGPITFTVSFACGNKKVTSQKVFQVNCCDCSKLPKEFAITGPAQICIGPNCNELLTYRAPDLGNSACFTHHWSVSPNVGANISGNQLNIKCGALTPGTTYTITDSIWCGNQSYTVSSIKLTACKKPDPTLTSNVNTSANTVTFSSTVGCTNKWYFFEDVNTNCQHDAGTDGVVFGQFGNTVTFGGLVAGKQYVVHHYVECACGPNGQICRSLQPFCFRYLPPSFMKQNPSIGNAPANSMQLISDKQITDSKEIEEMFKRVQKVALDKRSDQ